MASNELLSTIARVRRAMPRNADVMAICDAAEHSVVKVDGQPRFDRNAYMRGYMRHWRKRQAEQRKAKS
jgi:hypothetical protein